MNGTSASFKIFTPIVALPGEVLLTAGEAVALQRTLLDLVSEAHEKRDAPATLLKRHMLYPMRSHVDITAGNCEALLAAVQQCLR